MATEMYKVSNNFSTPHMNDIFEYSIYHGTESLSYLGSKVWDILPNIYKNIDDQEKFKKAIKKMET